MSEASEKNTAKSEWSRFLLPNKSICVCVCVYTPTCLPTSYTPLRTIFITLVYGERNCVAAHLSRSNRRRRRRRRRAGLGVDFPTFRAGPESDRLAAVRPAPKKIIFDRKCNEPYTIVFALLQSTYFLWMFVLLWKISSFPFARRRRAHNY